MRKAAVETINRLGSRLADLLDADHWNEIEPMLIEIKEAFANCDICGEPRDGRDHSGCDALPY